jgi:translation elongation factor P/translation initiation factor 5A
MKTRKLKWATMALIPAGIFTFTSCSSPPKGGTTEGTVTYQQGVPGGTLVDTYKTTATVTGIDPGDREVTLVAPDGHKSKVTAGPKVRNFGQIQVGDQVKVVVTRQISVSLLERGSTRSARQTSSFGSAPEGSKPAAMSSDTTEATAQIEALDLKRRKATLRFPDGDSETFEVRKDVDMSRAYVGQTVLIQSKQSWAVSVEKP